MGTRKERRMQNKQVSKQGRANPIKKIFICLINWGQSIFRPKICGILFYFHISSFLSIFFFPLSCCCCHVIRMQESNRNWMNLFLHLLFWYVDMQRRRKKETTFLNWLYWYNNLFIQGWFRSTFLCRYIVILYIYIYQYGYWCVSK